MPTFVLFFFMSSHALVLPTFTEAPKLFQCMNQLSGQGRPGTPIPLSEVRKDVLGHAQVSEWITPLGRPGGKGFLFESGPRSESGPKLYITLDESAVQLCKVPLAHETFILSFNNGADRVRTTHKKQISADEKDFTSFGSAQTYNGVPITPTMDGTYSGPTDLQYIRNVPTTCGLLQDSCYLDHHPACEKIPVPAAMATKPLEPAARDQANKIRVQLEQVAITMLRRLLESLPTEQQRTFTVRRHLKYCDMDFIHRYITNFKNEKGLILLEPLGPASLEEPGNESIQ